MCKCNPPIPTFPPNGERRSNLFKDKSIKFIDLYQRYLSPDHSYFKRFYPNGYCRYYPTCSEYTKLSIQKYGFLKGWLKGIYRIIRCNPFSKGGNDLP